MEALVFIVIFLVLIFITRRGKRKRYRKYRHHRGSFSKYDFMNWDAYAEQHASREPSDLSIVSDTKYRPSSVMGREEAHIFYKIENWVEARGRGERVFAQVPMGTYLKTTSDHAHRLIRHKRPDYLVVDRMGMPVCVVEYQGGGHYQGDALERDRIKKAALTNADIPLVEIFEHEKSENDHVWNKLNEAVGENGATETSARHFS